MGHTKQDVICVRGGERIECRGHVTSVRRGCASLSVSLVAWRGVEWSGVAWSAVPTKCC